MKKNILTLLLLLTSTILVSCKTNQKDFEYVEKDIVVETGEYQLPGKLTMPNSNNKVPAVLFIHGSGANDMNETIGKLKLFEELAIKLAKKGIASIRYDKRTYAYKEQLVNKFDFTIYDEVIDDAISAIYQLKSNDKISDIYIIGHSFGGQIAPLIANQTNIKGVITLASTTQHIIDVAMSQLKEQNSPYFDIYDPYDEYFRNIKELVPSEEKYFFMGAYEAYWVSYNNIDFNNELLICSKSKKMLIMQGGLDLQVKSTTIDEYKNILGNSSIYKLYEELNHMFVDGNNETIDTTYKEYKEIPTYVIEDIVNFIKS